MRFVRSGCLLFTLIVVMTAGLFAQSTVTSPEKFFGFQLGADRKMARWDKIVDYYGVIEKESGGQLKAPNMGPPMNNNPFLMIIISFARKKPPMPVKPVCWNVSRVPPACGSSR